MTDRPYGIPKPLGCKGWNYHVWSFGLNRCVICGISHAEAKAAERGLTK